MTVLVFGSINMDLFVELTALPRPGETVLTPSYRRAAGGKGANQAVAAARAGARVRLFGMVGEDGFGEELLARLKSEGVDCSGVGRSAEPTGLAFIAVDAKGENMIFGASGANLKVRAEQVPDYVFGRDLIVIMQMEISPVENVALARRARGRGARILLNHAPALPLPDGLLAETDILVLNQHEAAALAGFQGWSERGATEVAKRLVESTGMTAMVTQGEAGAVVASPDGVLAVPALGVRAIDTVGAGDAFVGVLAASLDAGRDVVDALKRASVAGALACEKLGAQTALPSREEIEARLPELAAVRRVG